MARDGFDGVANQVRASVYMAADGARQLAEPYPEAVQAVCLGALAGVCDLWADCASPVTRERFIEGMRDAVIDFAAQAFDNKNGRRT